MADHQIGIQPVSGGVGAEIHGIDLSRRLDDDALATLRRAQAEHGVLFFRDQRIDPPQHIAVAERFGRININRFFKAVPEFPQIAEVRKEPQQTTNIGGGWHTNHSYDKDDRIGNAASAVQDTIHPVVIRHPDSGRATLYVNPGFTLHFEGWTVEESKPLLDYLYQHAARPEFQTRFRWQPGSIAFWDNRATWHLAVNDYHGERRLMHRITLEGGPLAAAA